MGTRRDLFVQTKTFALFLACITIKNRLPVPLPLEPGIEADAATQVTASHLQFTRQVIVTNGPLPNTKSVSVLVSWQDHARTHTLPLATVIGQ